MEIHLQICARRSGLALFLRKFEKWERTGIFPKKITMYCWQEEECGRNFAMEESLKNLFYKVSWGKQREDVGLSYLKKWMYQYFGEEKDAPVHTFAVFIRAPHHYWYAKIGDVSLGEGNGDPIRTHLEPEFCVTYRQGYGKIEVEDEYRSIS